MKKLSLAMIFILILGTGCKTGNEKVNVIKGPGLANNSLMAGFSELCTGTVEGTLGKSDSILVSRINKNHRDFYSVDVNKKTIILYFSLTPVNESYHVEASPDGKHFIANDKLINATDGSSTLLPSVPSPLSSTSFDSYSFTRNSEPVMIDYYYYFHKYFKSLEKDLDNVSVPDFSLLSGPKFLDGTLKYLFLGTDSDEGKTSLYMIDLYEKKLTKVDENIKYYVVSPDQKSIAYVKKADDGALFERLYIYEIDDDTKKGIASINNIRGLTWSPDSQWIAYSVGETTQCDIYILHKDGTGNEQLTYGMNTTEKLVWLPTGNKLAFTSDTGSSSGNAKIYVITLNISARPADTGSTPESKEKQLLSEQLKGVLENETSSLLKSGAK